MRRIGRPLGDVAPAPAPAALVAAGPTEGDARTLARQVKQAMIEQAATQTTITLVLDAFVPFGTIASAVLTLMQFMSGREQKKALDDVIAKFKNDAQRVTDDYQQKFEAAQDQVYETERSEVIRRVSAGEAVNGLGFSLSFRKIGHVLQQSHVKPFEVVRHVSMKTAEAAAKVVGAKSAAQKLHMDDAKMTAFENKTDRVVTGEQGIYVARQKTAEMLAAMKASYAQQYLTLLNSLNDPSFRAHLRMTIYQAMLADPEMAALLKKLPSTTADPNGPTAAITTKQVLPAAGALAALWFFLR